MSTMCTIRVPAILSLTFTLVSLIGCATSPYVPEPQPLEPGRLASPDVSANIPNLRPCTDSPDTTLRFNSNYPVTVLVHGCNGSAGRFRSLAQLYAFHGQQAVCYSYNDRDSLVDSSKQLVTAIRELSSHTTNPELSLIGHSMGGLIARKAMEHGHNGKLQKDKLNIKLTTISAPLAGIESASPCGNSLLHWLTLGTIPGMCWMISGDNWYEITSPSDFIQHPEPLRPSVQQYLRIVTDERDTCRRKDKNGTCIESDYIFSVAEQYHPIVDKYPKLTNVEVEAGHVEIVGNKQIAPRKLLAILQQQGMLASTPPERRAALEQLLAKLY